MTFQTHSVTQATSHKAGMSGFWAGVCGQLCGSESSLNQRFFAAAAAAAGRIVEGASPSDRPYTLGRTLIS